MAFCHRAPEDEGEGGLGSLLQCVQETGEQAVNDFVTFFGCIEACEETCGPGDKKDGGPMSMPPQPPEDGEGAPPPPEDPKPEPPKGDNCMAECLATAECEPAIEACGGLPEGPPPSDQQK